MEALQQMGIAGKRAQWKAEDWLQWNQEDWGGAEIPVNPPDLVKTGAANRLTKVAVEKWLRLPDGGLWGRVIAANSLRQQWEVQKRLADRKALQRYFAAKKPPEKIERSKGADARNHSYWKWMEWRANLPAEVAKLEAQDAVRKRHEWIRTAMEAADTHPWAHRADIRHAWNGIGFRPREWAVWRSVVYACWKDTRKGMDAWPIWMQPQKGGKKSKDRVLPRVGEPDDGTHAHGRNRRLREVFEGLPTRADQMCAVRVMIACTGSAPSWMIPREIDTPKGRGRPRKSPEKVS